MEPSRKIFLRIASASNKVIDTANKYADYKDLGRVPRAHFQLESDMQKISIACEGIADILRKSNHSKGPELDGRLQDWLDTDEPQKCQDTLVQMEKLLQKDAPTWMSWVLQRGRGATTTQDRIKEAIDLFNSCKGYFHHFFSMDILNYESRTQQQQDVSPDDIAQKETNVVNQAFPYAIQAEMNIAPRNSAIHHGRMDSIIQVSSVSDGPIRKDHRTIISDTTINKRGLMSGQRRHVMPCGRSQLRLEENITLEAIIPWIDGLNCAEKQDVMLSLRQPDTCNWLFDTTPYKQWRDGDSSFLWLRGKPGAGKSVLASSVIASLENSLHEGEFLSFFYFDFRDERFTSTSEALRSILSQLLRQICDSAIEPRHLVNDLVKAKQRGSAMLKNAKLLAEVMSQAARSLIQKPLVVVDALDECKDVRELIQALMVMKEDVRLFVTSRRLHGDSGALSGLPFISMDDTAVGLTADIELHIIRELDARHRLRDLDAGLKMEIRTVLCDKADGMFRWVRCSIDTLERCLTRKEIRNALNSLPEGLDETYERILRAIDSSTGEGQLAHRVLIWLVAALRPLQLFEIMEGLSINLKTRKLDSDFGPMHSGALLDVCGSLVTYSERTGVIMLSHSSVKEYLTGEFILTKLPRYHVDWERAHLHLARICMCYISICLKLIQNSTSGDSNDTPVDLFSSGDTLSKGENRPDPTSQPLCNYVLNDALDHLRHLGPQFESVLPDMQRLAEVIERYSESWNDLRMSARRVMCPATPSWPKSIHDFTLYILVAFAPHSLLHRFLRRTTLKPKEGTNPLVYAAYFNREAHARILIWQGARLNRGGWDTNGHSQSLPIEVALQHQHYDMVTLFLDERSTIPPRIFRQLLSDDSPFPPMPPSIRMKLLQCDDFVEGVRILPVDTWKRLLDHWGPRERELIEIIRRFVQVFDDDPTCYPAPEEALLRFAVNRGYCSIVQYLSNLHVPFPPDLPLALDHWSSKTTFPMLRVLAENGANICVRNSNGDSVLHNILRYFHDDDALDAAKFLVTHGCLPLEVNSTGKTALHVAAERNLFSVVQYFLAVAGPVPSDMFLTLDRWGGWKTSRMIHLLIESGANPFTTTDDGDSALHIVLQSFYNDENALKAVKYLVRRGCNPLGPNLHGKTPLHFAVQRSPVSVSRYLLSLGALLPFDVLLVALDTRRRKLSMIKFLIDQGASVHAIGPNGDTVLHVVARVSFSEDHGDVFQVFSLLVEQGCNPAISNHHGETPLHVASEHGHTKIMEYLLFQRNVPRPSNILFSAIQSEYLSQEGALHVIEILVDAGCNVLALNPAGNTPLHAAIIKGHVDVVKYLLSVMDTPHHIDLLSAAALAPSGVRAKLGRMLTRARARSESEDRLTLAKRVRYS